MASDLIGQSSMDLPGLKNTYSAVSAIRESISTVGNCNGGKEGIPKVGLPWSTGCARSEVSPHSQMMDSP